ncbi:MAG: potassium channel family protein [Candidatus Hadarchaeales archaeon]
MRRGEAFELVLVVLALVSVALLLYELDHPETAWFTSSCDFVIALLFLGEYLSSTFRAERRLRYALTHWYDLLASIPIPFSAVRMFRTIRVVRLVRVIRTLRVLRLSRAFTFLSESRLGTVVVALLMVLLFGATSFHILEYGQNPSLHGSLDALYWAAATLSTVGYGDIVAVTSAGKVLTVVLMLFGIGVYATLAGLLAGYLVKGREGEEDLEERIARMEAEIREISGVLRSGWKEDSGGESRNP